MSKLRVAAVLVAAAILSGCGPTSSPASPSPTNLSSSASVTGTWTGTTIDSTGSAKAVLTINQTGPDLVGKMSMMDDVRSMVGNGTMRGAMNGSSFTIHMEVPAGGFNGMMAPCSMVLTGNGMMSADGRTLNGSYTGNFSGMMSSGMMGSGMMGSQHSCGGVMTNGTFSMTR